MMALQPLTCRLFTDNDGVLALCYKTMMAFCLSFLLLKGDIPDHLLSNKGWQDREQKLLLPLVLLLGFEPGK